MHGDDLCSPMEASEPWKASLLAQLSTRNHVEGQLFREVLSVHARTATDERQYRKRAHSAEPAAAEAAPLREKHNAVLLENADLQRRLQQAEQSAQTLTAENALLREKIRESTTSTAATLNELNDNLEFYRQQEAAAATTLPPPPIEPAAPKEELPPIVGVVNIVQTKSGHDEYTGLEYTNYVMSCTAVAASGDDAATAVAASEWPVSKRFSDFSNLRADLVALPTVGPVVETMEFPASTWAFMPWGAGKMDEETIVARRAGLQSWLNSVLGTFPAEPAVRNFLQAELEPEPEPEAGAAVEAPALEGRAAIVLWSFEPPSGQEGTHVAVQKGETLRLLREVSKDCWFMEE